jgi:hypothetical protein
VQSLGLSTLTGVTGLLQNVPVIVNAAAAAAAAKAAREAGTADPLYPDLPLGSASGAATLDAAAAGTIGNGTSAPSIASPSASAVAAAVEAAATPEVARALIRYLAGLVTTSDAIAAAVERVLGPSHALVLQVTPCLSY